MELCHRSYVQNLKPRHRNELRRETQLLASMPQRSQGVFPSTDVISLRRHAVSESVRCRSSSLSSFQTLQEARSQASSTANVLQRSNHGWFVDAVPSIVRRLAGSTSSLHVVHTRSSAVHVEVVPQDSATSPEFWRKQSEDVRLKDADGIVLVRPITDPCDYCPLQRPPLALTENMGGSSGSFQPGSQHAPRLHTPHHSEASSSSQPSEQRCFDSSDTSPCTSYYGVVVQSRSERCRLCSSSAPEGCGTDGCYVLKLCKSPGLDAGSPGSTHYTLTKVSQGQPLYSQLWEPWLA